MTELVPSRDRDRVAVAGESNSCEPIGAWKKQLYHCLRFARPRLVRFSKSARSFVVFRPA